MKQEFKEVEFRYGFSFPWMMLPVEMQEAIDALEHSYEVHDRMDDVYRIELQSLMEIRWKTLGYRIADEIAKRYDLALPEYWH